MVYIFIFHISSFFLFSVLYMLHILFFDLSPLLQVGVQSPQIISLLLSGLVVGQSATQVSRSLFGLVGGQFSTQVVWSSNTFDGSEPSDGGQFVSQVPWPGQVVTQVLAMITLPVGQFVTQVP